VWRDGYDVEPATMRSQVRVPAASLHVTTLGKLFTQTHTHTHVPPVAKLLKSRWWNSDVNVELVTVVKFSRNGLERQLKVPERRFG